MPSSKSQKFAIADCRRSTGNMKRDRPLLLIGLLTAVVPTTLLFLAVTYLFAFTLLAGLTTAVLAMWPVTKAERIIGIFLCGATTLGSIGLLTYASSEGSPTKLIVPNNYVGEIRILEDKKAGIPPVKEKVIGFTESETTAPSLQAPVNLFAAGIRNESSFAMVESYSTWQKIYLKTTDLKLLEDRLA